MEKLPLPMNTVLDGPERDPMLDDEAVAVLKAVYLRQPQVPEFRARGMSDTEIVDAMHGIAQAGILNIVQHGGRVGLAGRAGGFAVPPLIVGGREIAERRVPASRVVEAFDEGEHRQARLGPGS